MTPPDLTKQAETCLIHAFSKELNQTTSEGREAIERVLRKVWLDGFYAGKDDGIRKVNGQGMA
jgi:hypothetical protein